MPQTKHISKAKRSNKTASVLGIAGVSLTATAGGSAAALPAQFVGAFNPPTFYDEEISDVSLATFHVFNPESPETPQLGIQLAHGGCGCGHGGGGGQVAADMAVVADTVVAAATAAVATVDADTVAADRRCLRRWLRTRRVGGGWRGCGGCGCGIGGCGCAGGGGCCLSWGGCWPTC